LEGHRLKEEEDFHIDSFRIPHDYSGFDDKQNPQIFI